MIAATTGIGKITASELLAAAGIDSNTTALTAEEEQRLANAIYSLQQSANQQTSAPVYAVISRTNQVKTILPFAPTILEPGCNTKQLPDINSALNYAVTLTPIQLPEQETLQKLVIGESQRLEKAAGFGKDLLTADKAEAQRMIADTIMANIYQISKGQSSCQLLNIYDNEPLEIQLSPYFHLLKTHRLIINGTININVHKAKSKTKLKRPGRCSITWLPLTLH